MIVPLSALAFAATLLSSQSLTFALSASDTPLDTPVSSLLSSANSHLARGETSDALDYYEVAIARDPSNYLTLFKRGAAYLSLGRTVQALSDFDAVLEIKEGFEGALLQRAKIKGNFGDWAAARTDYTAAGHTGSELAALTEAESASKLAADAEKRRDYEQCVTQADAAIMVASRNLALRQLRARCRFEQGEVYQGITDLAHVLQLQPGDIEPHVQISAIRFFALADVERGMDQIRKCLHSDPDSKRCKKLHRREKQIDKELSKVVKLLEKRSFVTAAKHLVGQGEDAGLIQSVREEAQELRAAGTIPEKAPNTLFVQVIDMACKAHVEMKSKKTSTYCTEALKANPESLYGLLFEAQRSFDAENYEACIDTLKTAKKHHEGNQHIEAKIQEAEIALRRSKQKDYYKVLGVSRDADKQQIRGAYRKKTREHHPDKAVRVGVTKEDAEKKMASINEAYEVLSDPELRARFDQGDDPNNHEPQGHPFQQGNPFQQGHAFQQGRPFRQGNPFQQAGHGFGFQGFQGFPFG